MTSEATVRVVEGVLSADPGTAPATRRAVVALLSSGRMTAAEAAVALRISRRTFFDRLAKGRLTVRRYPQNRKVVLFDAGDVLRASGC
jgi:hypothetical protein